MAFTVTWSPGAKDVLADLWCDAPDRAALATAANRIDQMLKQGPLEAGEERDENNRILFESPLAVIYKVSELDCTVEVWGVWVY